MILKEQLLKIGREYSTKGAQQLGEEIGISKQRIQQMVVRLRKLGAPIPRIRNESTRTKEIKEVAEQLKRELET